MIFSEIMIMGILILQGLVLAFQEPNLLYWGFLIFSLTLQAAVVSATVEDISLYKKCERESITLKSYAAIVLVLQIGYHFVNDPNFLAKYGWDSYLSETLASTNTGILNYMDMIGFYKYETGKERSGIVWLFLSPILFYITTTILKDHFSSKKDKLEKLDKQEKVQINMDEDEKTFDAARRDTMGLPTFGLDEDEKHKIELEYARVRFSVQYLVYKSMDYWRIIDKLAINFHLITAAAAIYLCTNWQVSLFMYF
jgi:hypothetical protein